MQSSRRRATVATLLGSTTNTLIVAIQAIVLIPLYLQAVGPRLYGAWLGSGDILVWMQAFDLGLPNLLIQRIGAAYGRDDSQAVGEYFATGIVALGFVASIVTFCAILISFWLPRGMRLEGVEAKTLQSAFMVGAIAAGFNILNNSVVGFSRGIQDTTFLNAATIVSSISGFVVSTVLVLTGWGLWAIVLGLVTRTSVSLMGSVIFTIKSLRGELSRFFRVRPSLLREFVASSPATALGGVGYAVMNQSESALVAFMLSPELATVFTLTRKAIEMAQSIVDTIAIAAYGSFAHLVASAQREKSLRVYGQIVSLRFSLAFAVAAAYLAVNKSLITVWVDGAYYGGAFLTILLGARFIVTGGSFLMNYLYRATGPVVRGSLLLSFESLVRITLMIWLLRLIGLPGLPVAGMVSGIVFGYIAYRWIYERISVYSLPVRLWGLRVWIARFSLFCIGIAACVFFFRPSWVDILGLGSSLTILGALILLLIDPLVADIRSMLFSALTRLSATVHRYIQHARS